MSEKPLIAITMGDPCGVGPEIIVKALQSPDVASICTPFVIGDRSALERALAVCGSALTIHDITCSGRCFGTLRMASIPLLAAVAAAGSGSLSTDGQRRYQVMPSTATSAQPPGSAWTVVWRPWSPLPISKEAMNRAGHDYPGHTELLAELCGTDDFVMMLAGDVLRVSLVTIHEALADIPRLITFEQVLKTIRITAAGVARLTGKTRPRLAVLALNPHCGEGGMFGSEEREIIAPAIQAARAEGIDAVGPLSADTLFYFAGQGAYDGVVAMYHDQGLIPLKMLHFDDGVNITLGLPIIRTSVDHGTAYDLAGTGRASEKSLLAAIRMAVQMAKSQ